MTADIGWIRYYFTSLSSLLARPRVFFRQLPEPCLVRYPLIFLLLSGCVATAASLISGRQAEPLAGGLIFFINAVGLTVIFATIGYLAARLMLAKKVAFTRVLAVYALSSGLVLHAAWMPNLWIFTEPWKWWLIGVGMIHACNLKTAQALAVIGMSGGIWMLVVWALLPLTAL